MRLITGPAGSGKTAWVLDRFREALRANDHAVRLLVPTATMAQHLGNQIAREGFVFRRGLIETLNNFIENQVSDFPQASDEVVYLLVEEAIARVNRPEFRRVAQMPGFCARVARAVLEFSATGCDSDRLAACLPEAPLAAAFFAVYQEVDRALDRRGLLLRSKRLECAAARIHNEGIADIRTIWLDGFHALPDPELVMVQALGAHLDLTLTFPDSPTTAALRARLAGGGFREERFEKRRAAPAAVLVKAPRMEREVEEIARRILEQHAAGRPFREIGIIVRAEGYVQLLRATLERFSIPARFYFDTPAAQHPAIRFLTGAIDAMLSGWDHRATLGVLRLAPRFADSYLLDRLDFKVREQIPNKGLGALKALLPDTESSLARFIDRLSALDELRSFELTPTDWAARLSTLRDLYHLPRVPDEATSEAALIWRGHAEALKLFDKALADAAVALEPGRLLRVADFWRAVKSVLRLKPLRVSDSRRDLVHVLSAPEARNWVLPVVFVCDLVERQFPQLPPQDLFFPEAARHRLQQAGIRIRTAADFEQEERALFDSAVSRATMLVTLSYPEFTARGERNLPSLFINRLLRAEASRVVRPAPRYRVPAASIAAIHSPALLAAVLEKTAAVSVSNLESWLECPFRYFAGGLLKLQTTPPLPEDRLDYSLQGQIVHEVLARWLAQREDISKIFAEVFANTCERKQIPQGYHTERLRLAMLRDLERFAADTQWQRSGFASRPEEKFQFALNDSLAISGRIDRIDTDEQNAGYVIDYKYSAAEQVKKKRNGNQLQGPLYLLAAENQFGVRPTGMFFVALKGGVEYIGWSEKGVLGSGPIPAEWSEAPERVTQIAGQIRQGRIAPMPADPRTCGYCDSRDICRIEVTQATGLAETAEQS
ncbi:MAG TPA: PD-(D/E)XK nuclease family protein [Bryobacteraceae bacterium]